MHAPVGTCAFNLRPARECGSILQEEPNRSKGLSSIPRYLSLTGDSISNARNSSTGGQPGLEMFSRSGLRDLMLVRGNYTHQTTKMYKLMLVSMLVVSVAILEIACMDTMVAPPPRPAEFRSPNELRSYLKALNEYYAIVGRPRFGKRNGAARSPDFFRPNGEASADEGQGWGEYL
ncbi:hypothetical protein RRG08_062196 [Elysia crispata]|uniref:Neuropeptide Y n=1 Tax=Elysia crispata TaxID=231223 RepID=A0AAE1CVD1_9GAST|nr:hypothetical protein RRG08_062196 [Elysia crispata]